MRKNLFYNLSPKNKERVNVWDNKIKDKVIKFEIKNKKHNFVIKRFR